MTQKFDNTNRGALFANKDRESDNHPHATGTLNVDGTEYWISAWTKTSSKGERFQSLSVKRKQPKQERRELPPSRGIHEDPLDDSQIPF